MGDALEESLLSSATNLTILNCAVITSKHCGDALRKSEICSKKIFCLMKSQWTSGQQIQSKTQG